MCLSVPAKVEKISGMNAIVDFGGTKKEVSIMLFPDLKVDDFVLVHAGFVIQKLDRDEATKTIKLFKEIYENKE
ncbi:MAG: HypC/HybG/HupF family hydrogenase formation chaperone [Elusimicrobiales bacterium]